MPADGDVGVADIGTYAAEDVVYDPEPAPASRGSRLWIATAVLVLLGFAWTVLVLLRAADRAPWLSLDAFLAPVMLSAPISVLLLAYVIIARGGRGEARRFHEVARALRAETTALDDALGRMTTSITTQNQLLADQAGQVMALGDETAGRLHAIEAAFARDVAGLSEHGVRLAHATDAARTDLGVILADLPRMDEQVRGLSEQLRQTGLGAREQAGALDSQLTVLTARGREADEIAGGAAQRLAAHLARIEGASGIAGQRIDEVGEQMAAAADAALDHAARVLGELRAGLAVEQQTLITLIDRSHALITDTGVDAVGALAGQLDGVEARLAAFNNEVAREGEAIRTLAAALGDDLDRAERQLTTLGAAGGERTTALIEALGRVRQDIAAVQAAVEAGDGATGQLLDRAEQLSRMTAGLDATLHDAEAASDRVAGRVADSAPRLTALAADATAAAEALDRAGADLAQHRAAVDALRTAIADTDSETQALVEAAAPALLDALRSVSEAAEQAASQTRSAFADIAPQAATALADASRDAVDDAVSATVGRQLQTMGEAADRAVQAAASASDRLMRQMLTIADITGKVENRIAESREQAEQADAENFSRRVALLIEAINSTAIDVAKILSNDVTDTAWAAYLRGDRGVFTRRAVRLLDSGEARAIAGKYNEDAEFREQVNRYVHDFEAMLRRVLASRDGRLLGVTLLSSDMGKLYVALAQAIERLRS